MINNFKRRSLFWMAVATGLTATQAFAQAPTDAQRNAIKSACRSDYMAHCASVPPGGGPALQCLQKNMASLSASCQAAVTSVAPAADVKPAAVPAAAESKPAAAPPAAESKPATEAAKPAVVPPATEVAKPVATEKPASTTTPKPMSAAAAPSGTPSDAQVAAIRGACRKDYPNFCAAVPTGGAAALQCLEKNSAKLSAACGKAVAAASGGAATPAAAVPAEPVLVLRPMRPLEELRVLNAACGPDAKALCSDVQSGGGRIVRCLAANAKSLSPACKGMLAEFAAR